LHSKIRKIAIKIWNNDMFDPLHHRLFVLNSIS
jgi:hypothetical protein